MKNELNLSKAYSIMMLPILLLPTESGWDIKPIRMYFFCGKASRIIKYRKPTMIGVLLQDILRVCVC